MTAKILSWTTFGLLLAGSVPFVSDPSVTASVNAFATAPGGGTITPSLAPCGACNVKPTQEFQKGYAIDRNSLCDPATPYRVTIRLASKIICEGGSYWLCEDTSSMSCSTYTERPTCPEDTCAK
jgi:hypothetical protein